MSVRSVFQSVTPADRTSYSSSLGIVRARAACACVLVWRDVPRKACARAGVARRAAKKKKKKCRPKNKGQRSKTRKKAACVPQGWGVRWQQRCCACAAILATPVLCMEREEL